MPNEKQDLINHKLTATACKNYTDKQIKKTKDELKTFFSKNNINTIDHTNELAYQITAPAGAKLLQLQSVGGNAVKYNPTFASDDTSALVKTMPSVVYDLDVDKIKGVSEVSENLIVLNDKAEITVSGITYSASNGVITFSGTATETVTTYLYFNTEPIYMNGDYYWTSFLKFNGNFNLQVEGEGTIIANGWGVVGKTANVSNKTASKINIAIPITNGETYNLTIKPMLIKGTTAPNEFKVGFEGIHNNELSGLKVEGANLFDKYSTPMQVYIDGTIDKLTPNLVANTFEIAIKPNTAYTIYCFEKDGSRLRIGTSTTAITEGYLNNVIRATVNDTITFKSNFNDNYLYVNIKDGSDISSVVNGLYISIGSSAPTTYQPYISPTTLPIDLTSIVDSSGNKLFEDGSLKGINDVYDEITPYKAIKRFGVVDLGTLDFILASGIFYAVISDKENNNDNIGLCTNYDIISKNATNLGEATSLLNDKEVALSKGTSNPYIYIKDSAYDNVQTFKTAMSGVYLYYELATPQEADIDLPQLKGIEGHSNGSITALNTYDMAVPSEITYNSIIQETLVDSVIVEGANLADSVTLTDNVSSDYKPLIVVTNLDLKPNTTYTISFRNVNTLASGTRYYITADNQSISYIYTDANSSKTEYSMTFTPSKPETTIRIRLQYTSSGNTGITTDVMLNEGSTALSYRPYKAPITRNLPTITSDGYGVNANAHNLRVFSDYEGNETKERHIIVGKVDLGSLNYSYNSEYNFFYSAELENYKYSIDINALCSKYDFVGVVDSALNFNSASDKTFAFYNGNPVKRLYIKDSNYTDVATFKTAMSGVYLYYELATEDISQLDYFDYFFDIEEGDVITFNNPYAQQVYATYSFITKEVKYNEK